MKTNKSDCWRCKREGSCDGLVKCFNYKRKVDKQELCDTCVHASKGNKCPWSCVGFKEIRK